VESRVDVIVNRRAKRLVDGGRCLASIRAAEAASNGRVGVHETRSLDDLDRAVASVRDRGTDLVVLAGGDGSYLAGTTALDRAFGSELPPLAFAPGGTVCTVARNWGVAGAASTYAGRLVEAALRGATVTTLRPTLRVRDERGGDRVGFIFGAGLVARFFDAYYESPAPGIATAAALVGRIFVGTFTGGALARRVLEPGRLGLVVDGARQPADHWSLVAASVVQDLGLHMRLLYRAGDDPGAFHAVASVLPPRALAPQVGRVLAGRPLRGAGHVDALVRELVVELDAGGGASTFVLDGDRIEAGRVTVTPGPMVRYVTIGG
jgi:diacylglycerol kinase family enzyme